LSTNKDLSVLMQKLMAPVQRVLVCSAFSLFLVSSTQAKDDDPNVDNHSEPKILDTRPDLNDVSDMAFIRVGKFFRGSNFEENKAAFKMCRKYDKSCKLWWFSDEYPGKLVSLDNYWIDIYEVTNVKYKKYVDETKAKKPLGWESPKFKGDQQPVVGISWKEAMAYCKWSGKRLPTEAEWEKASRGKRPVKYPWGDSLPNSEKLNFNEEKKRTVSVGYYEKGKSDYGIYDLSGNVSEWVQDWHFPEYYLFSPKENPKGPEKGQYKIIRGGNWRNTAEYVDLTYRNATTPRMRNTGIGFRCAKSAL